MITIEISCQFVAPLPYKSKFGLWDLPVVSMTGFDSKTVQAEPRPILVMTRHSMRWSAGSAELQASIEIHSLPFQGGCVFMWVVRIPQIRFDVEPPL